MGILDGILDFIFGDGDSGDDDHAGWKASQEHSGDDDRAGWKDVMHKDIYPVDESGKRDGPHHQDMKIDYDSNRRNTSDIKKR